MVEWGPHGGDAERVARRLGLAPGSLLDLSMSLNPCAPDVGAVLAGDVGDVGDVGALLGRYPDPGPATARLADAIGVDPARFVLTNGGAEAIALVAAELGTGAVEDPEFSLYRRHLAVLDAAAGRWRSNPSNPLGRLAAAHEQAAVWDEAFWPLATGSWTRGDETSWRLGSLTKLWACPGVRLGYVIAPDAAPAARVRHRQPRWAVNGLALAMVDPLLARTDLRAWAAAIAVARDELVRALAAAGFDVTPTAANWVLVHTTEPLRDRLARRGVLVRDASDFGLVGTYRVAVPPRHEHDRVVAAFAATGP